MLLIQKDLCFFFLKTSLVRSFFLSFLGVFREYAC